MILKLLAFCFFAILLLGLGVTGTVSGLVKGYHKIESNPVLQNFSASSIQQIKVDLSNDTQSNFISELRNSFK